MAYIGKSPQNGVRQRYIYSATANQTSFSGNDINGISLIYSDGMYLDVYKNGVLLKPETAYVSTTGTTVVLSAGASNNDVLEMIVYDVFSVNDSISASKGGSFGGNIAMGGTLSVTGNTTVGGTLAQVGVATFTARDVHSGGITIANAGQIGSVGDTDAIAIASNGQVTLTQQLNGTAADFTGDVSGATFQPDGDTAAGDNAAIGFTAAEGLILTGQGSTNDITVKNDADASVFVVPTGTQKMVMGQATSFGGANTSILEVMKVGNAAAGFGRGDADLGACVRFFKVNSGGTGTIVGSISLASSSTTYATSSDYRLKTSVSYDWDATTRLKNLKPARFKWISDGDSAEFVDGFIAHEAATVVPESVTGDKDAVDSDGNIDPQGIDASKLVPLLCKTILELEARITALENA